MTVVTPIKLWNSFPNILADSLSLKIKFKHRCFFIDAFFFFPIRAATAQTEVIEESLKLCM